MGERDGAGSGSRESGAFGGPALLVHAIDESVAELYQQFGFAPSALRKETLFLSMQSLRESLRMS